MVILDLMGRRWAGRIIWELRDGRKTARELRTACDNASPTVLNQRLKELTHAGWVAHMAGEGYGLTEEGRQLLSFFLPLYTYAEKWARRQASQARNKVG